MKLAIRMAVASMIATIIALAIMLAILFLAISGVGWLHGLLSQSCLATTWLWGIVPANPYTLGLQPI